MQFSILLVFMAVFAGVKGDCSPDKIKKVESYWNGKPLTKIIDQLRGDVTWLTALPINKDIKQQDICSERASFGYSAVFLTFLNSTIHTPFTDVYKVEEGAGRITLTNYRNTDNVVTLYPISIQNKIFVYLACVDNGPLANNDGFTGLGALQTRYTEINYKEKNVVEGFSILKSLGLPPLQNIQSVEYHCFKRG